MRFAFQPKKLGTMDCKCTSSGYYYTIYFLYHILFFRVPCYFPWFLFFTKFHFFGSLFFRYFYNFCIKYLNSPLLQIWQEKRIAVVTWGIKVAQSWESQYGWYIVFTADSRGGFRPRHLRFVTYQNLALNHWKSWKFWS